MAIILHGPNMQTCTHAHIQTYAHTNIRTHTHIQTYAHKHTHIHIYTQAREMQKIQGMTEELVMERSKVTVLEAALLQVCYLIFQSIFSLYSV